MGRSRFPGKPFKFQNRKRISILSDNAFNENNSESLTDGFDASDSCFRETFSNETQNKEENANLDRDNLTKDSEEKSDQEHTSTESSSKSDEIEHKDTGQKSNIRTRSQQKMEVVKSVDVDKNMNVPVKKTVRFGRVESCDSFKPLKKLPFKPQMPLVSIIKKKSAFKLSDSSFGSILKPAKLTDLSSKISVDFSEFRARNSHSPPLRKSSVKFSSLSDARLSPPPFGERDLKKFILPSRSVHSSRVIKPNKRFMETEDGVLPLNTGLLNTKVLKKPKLVFGDGSYYDEAYETCDSSANSNDSADSKTTNLFREKTLGLFGSGLTSGHSSFGETFMKATSEGEPLLRHSIQTTRSAVDTPCTSDQSSNSSTSESSESETGNLSSDSDNESDLEASRLPSPERLPAPSQLSSGKLILREARLQLNPPNAKTNTGTEGPFSSFSNGANASSNANISGTLTCGVCGAVKFYRFIKQARKFGIYSCESCRKFISKMLKRAKLTEGSVPPLECLNGEGSCHVPVIIRSQWKLIKCAYNARCNACWLKMCIKAFQVQPSIKTLLQAMLPTYMRPNAIAPQTSMPINPLRPLSQTSTLPSNTSFPRRKRNEATVAAENQPPPAFVAAACVLKKSSHEAEMVDEEKHNTKKKLKEKSQKKDAIKLAKESENDKDNAAGRKRRHIRVKVRKKSKVDAKEADTKRQKVELKGPRVKHVCRSASIVLGQPLATFPTNDNKEVIEEPEPSIENKEITIAKENIPMDLCNDCDTKTDDIDIVTILPENQKDDKASLLIKDVANNNIDISTGKKRKGNNDCISSLKPDSHTDAEEQAAEITHRKALKQYVCNSTNIRAYQRLKPSDKQLPEMILTDFWESYDPDEVCKTGWGLITTQPFSLMSVCFLCGSKGRDKLIFCAGCCEAYHPFCVESTSPGVTSMVTTIQKFTWLCPLCVLCKACNKHTSDRANTYCYNCKGFFHANCLTANLNGKYRSDWPKICSGCLKCKSCDSFKVTKFLGSLPFCSSCFRLRQKGNYCPLCQGCYQDNDFDSKMMECGWCSRWVHARCEGLSGEGYQLLSALPHNVEYICRQCLPDNPPWREMLGTYLRGKLLILLKVLAKNKDACALLKLTPHKSSPVENRLCLCESPVAVRKLMFDDCSSKTISKENTVALKEARSIQPQNSAIVNRTISLNADMFPHSPPLMHKITVINLQESLMQNKEICFSTGIINPDNDGRGLRGGYEMRECCVKVNDNSQSSEDENEMQVALGSDVQTSVRLVPTAVHDDKYENISDDDEVMAENLNDKCLVIHKDDQNATNVTVACLQGHSADIDCPCESIVNREAAPSLLDVKKRVNSNEYASLKEFNGDMQEAIRKTHSTDLKTIYKDTFSETFPWFDCELNCLNPDLEIEDDCDDTESLKDEDMGENFRKSRINISTDDALQDHVVPKLSTELKSFDDYLLDDSVIEDNRHCILCKITGEGLPSMEGRLLYCGQNDWIHANCALWSNEVFEEIDGSLQNVQSAIARGKTIKCASCDTKGASVSCCTKNCNTSFHFSCARKGKCAFLDDKRVFCPSHASDIKEKLQKENDFELIRPVYVELDRKRKKYNEPNKVQFLLGGLTVRNLGRIVPSVSDHEDILIPIDFVCSKMYWSTKQPWKIIQYTIKTKLLLAEPLPGFDLGVNITVDHSLSSNVVDRIMAEINSWQKGLAANEHIMMKKKDISPIKFRNNITMTLEDIAVKQVVEHLLDCVCRNEQQDDAPEEEPQNTADLLPPELKDAIFEDLNHDLLDGISMQDIFPKLMSYEDLIAIDLKSEYFSNEIPKESKSTDQRDDINTKQGDENSNNTAREKNKNEGWTDSKSSGSDFLDDLLNARLEAGVKELKRSKSEVFLQNANIKNLSANRSHQRSGSLTWNCKLDSSTRTNSFKKCKLPRTLNKINSNPTSKTNDVETDSVLEVPPIEKSDNAESSPIPEKHWQSNQIRMIQMDGTLDSASESGSSTRSVDEDQFHASPSATPLTVNKIKEQKPQSLTDNVIDFYTKMQCSPISQLDGADDFSSSGSECNSPMLSPIGRDDTDFTPIPQLDGADEVSSSGSESNSPRNPPNQVYFRANSNENVYTVTVSAANMSSATEMLMRSPPDDGFLRIAQIEQTVRCDRCHCTYRNKESYDRHLPSCDMMSTSESESETPKSPETRSLNTHSFHGSFIQPTTLIAQQANYESFSDSGKPGLITSRRTSVNTRQITINGTIVETPSPSPINSDGLFQSDVGNNKTNSMFLDTSKQPALLNPQILSSQIIVNPSVSISPPKNSISNQKMYNQQLISGPSTGLPYNICMKPTNLGNANMQNIHTMQGNGNINHILTNAGNLHNVISSNSNQVLTIAPHQQNIAPALHSKPQTIQTFTAIPNTSNISLNGNTLQAIPTSLGNPMLHNIQPMIRPQMQNSTILMPNMNARLASPNSQQKHQIILPQCSQKSPKKQSPIQTKPLIQATPRSKSKAFTKTPTLKRQTRMDKPIQLMNQPMSLANGNIIQLQHNQSGQPSIIVQQVPNSNIMSAYVEALSQQQGQNLQYITTIGPQGDFKSTPTQFISQGGMVPQTFQIQQTENGGLVAVPSGGIPVLLPQGGVGILPQSALPPGTTILPQGSIQTQGILPQGTIQTQNGTTIMPQTIQTQNGTTILPQGTIHQSQGPNLLPTNSSQGTTIVPQSSMGNNQTILPQSALQSQGNTIISQPSGTATILPQGTTILPQGIQFCNDQVLLGSTPALEMVTDSSGCMYMQVATQPVYYGLETIVQNTVMSSQQFVSTAMQGVLAQNSSFSATTTQVFQASKIEPIVEMPTGYVVVNNVPQDNIITSQANTGLVSPQSLSALEPQSSQTQKNLKSNTMPNISIQAHSDKVNIPISAPRPSTKVNHTVMGMGHSTVGNIHNTHSNLQPSNGQPHLRCQMTPGHVKSENIALQPVRSSITSVPSNTGINVAQSIANTNLVVSNCNISTISQPIVSSAITPSNVMKIPGGPQNHPPEMSDNMQNSQECNSSSNQQIFNLPLNVQQLLRNHPGAQVWRMPATSISNEGNKQQINLQMSLSQGNERNQVQKISIANNTPTTISSISIGQNIPANIRNYNHYGQTISAENGHPKHNLPPCVNIPTSSIQANHVNGASNTNINSHHMNHINVSSISNQSLCQQFSNHATIANHSVTTTASSTPSSHNQMMDVSSSPHNIQVHHQIIHNADMDMGRQQNFQNSCNLQRHNMHAEIVNNVLNNGNNFSGQVNNTVPNEKIYPSSNSMLLENFPQSGNPQVQNIMSNNRVNCGMSNHSNVNINNHMHNVQSVTNMSQCVVSNNQSGNNFANQSHLINTSNTNQNSLNQQIHNQILSLGNNSSPNMPNSQNHICHTANNRIHLINNMNGNNIQMNNSSNSTNVQIGGNMHVQSSNHCNNHSSLTMNNGNQQFNGPIISHMQMPTNNPVVHNNQQHIMSTNHNVYGPSAMTNNQSLQSCVNQSEISNSVNNNQSQMTSIMHSQTQCGLSNQPHMNNNSISNETQISNSTNNQSQSNSGNINNNLPLSNCVNIQPQLITGVNNQIQISPNMNNQSHMIDNIGNQQQIHNLNDHPQMSHGQNNQSLISDNITNQLSGGSLSNAVNSHSQIAINSQNQSSSSSSPNIQSHMINNMHNHMQMSNISHLNNQTLITSNMSNQTHVSNNLMNQSQNSSNVNNSQISAINSQYPMPQSTNISSQIQNNVANQAHISNNLNNLSSNVANDHIHNVNMENQTRMDIINSTSGMQSCNMSASFSNGASHSLYNQNNQIQGMNNVGPMHAPAQNNTLSNQINMSNSSSMNLHHNLQTHAQNHNVGNHVHPANNVQHSHNQMVLLNNTHNNHQPAVNSNEIGSHVNNNHNNMMTSHQLPINNNQIGNNMQMTNQMGVLNQSQINANNLTNIHNPILSRLNTPEPNRSIGNQETAKQSGMSGGPVAIPHASQSNEPIKNGNQVPNDRPANLLPQTISVSNQLGYLQMNSMNNRIINLPERNQVNHSQSVGSLSNQIQTPLNRGVQSNVNESLPATHAFENERNFPQSDVTSIRNMPSVNGEPNQISSPANNKPAILPTQQSLNQPIPSKNNNQVNLVPLNKASLASQQVPAPSNNNNAINLPIHNNANTINLPVQSSSSISLPKAPTHQSGIPTNVVNPMSTRPMNRVLPIHRDAQVKSAPRMVPQAPRVVPPPPPVPRNQDMPDLSIKEEDVTLDSDLEKAIAESKRTLELEEEKRIAEATAAAIAASQSEVVVADIHSEPLKDRVSNELPTSTTTGLKMVFHKQGESGKVYKVSSKNMKEKENKTDSDSPRMNIAAKVEHKLKRTIEGLSKTESAQILLQKKVPMRSKQLQESHMKCKQPYGGSKPPKDDSPKMLYEITSEDGFNYSSTSLTELWTKVVEAVQKARKQHGLSLLPYAVPPNLPGTPMLAFHNNALKYLVEQLPGANRCLKYKALNGRKILTVWDTDLGLDEGFKESAAGCARASVINRKPSHDIFNWLASTHRDPPLPLNMTQDGDLAISRRFTSSTMPMAMRFRHLKETSKLAVGVYRSHIHGRGLFCRKDIDAGEMVIEYAGEVIRAVVADGRERRYESGSGRTSSRVHGCYMFRIDDRLVVDATMKGNAARFINHSCDPNCYSRVVDILGHKHIIIFALRKINQGEELTYDYKFPFEDVKIPCTCGAKKCRKYLN